MSIVSRMALLVAVSPLALAWGCGPPIASTKSGTAVLTNGNVVRATSGDAQFGLPGKALMRPLSVVLVDENGRAVPDINVDFQVVSGAGSLAPRTVRTDAKGAASSVLTLGSVPGTTKVVATTAGSSAYATFKATVVGSPATLVVVSGDAQTGTVGLPLARPLVVACRDSAGHPIPGVAISFGVVPEGGTLTPATATTDGTGVAQTTLTLGASAGPVSVQARTEELLATFSEKALAGAAAAIRLISGDGQTGAANASLPELLGVQVVDANGNPVSGVTVTFGVTSGGGYLQSTTARTDSNGNAFAAWVLGKTAGPNTAVARAGTLAGSPVTFSATGVAGGPAKLVARSGGGQSGTVGTTLAAPLVVTAVDVNANPVAGVPVSFAVAPGGGSVATASAVTDSLGQATTTFTLGPTAGPTTVTASSGALAPITFAETATAGPASTITLLQGAGQTGTAGTKLPTALVVAVTDALANPVAGTSVTFSIVSGGGTLSPSSVTTGSNGQASTTLTLGPTAGTVVVSASVAGLPDTTWTETAVAGAQKSITAASGQAQSGPVGQPLGSPCTVLLLDAYGNGVSDVAVTFTPAEGSVSAATAVTDSLGHASTIWTLGTASGSQTLRASAASQYITFTATAVSAAPTSIFSVSGDAQKGTVGTALPVACVVAVVDSWSNPVPGVAVTFAATGGATPSPSNAVTDSTGQAGTTLTLGTVVGPVLLQASAAGVPGSPVSFQATGTAGPATTLEFTALPSSPAASYPFAPIVAVAARDAYGNLATTNVSVTVSAPDLTGPATVTTVLGVATFPGLAIARPAGGVVLTATANGLASATSAPFDVGLATGATLWTALPSLGVPRSRLGAATLGGALYTVGGVSASGPPSAAVERWAPGGIAWTLVASLNTARSGMGVVAINSAVYAIGGADANGPTTLVEVLEPSSGVWAVGPSLGTARDGCGAAVDDAGTIYVVGGRGANGSPLGVVEALAPGANAWAACPSLPTPRADLAVAVGPDGLIYAIGGRAASGPSAAVEVFDPSRRTWSTLPSLPWTREGLAAASGPDGRLYVLGGRDASGAPTTTAAAYSPSARAWTVVAPLGSAAGGLASTLGPDGRIVVAGGTSSGAAGAYGPTLALSATSGPAGSSFVANARSFPAKATVSVYWDGALLGSGVADSTGSVNLTVSVPPAAVPGAISVVAKDDRALYPVTAAFVVTP